MKILVKSASSNVKNTRYIYQFSESEAQDDSLLVQISDRVEEVSKEKEEELAKKIIILLNKETLDNLELVNRVLERARDIHLDAFKK